MRAGLAGSASQGRGWAWGAPDGVEDQLGVAGVAAGE
jgi:hypothetical protein